MSENRDPINSMANLKDTVPPMGLYSLTGRKTEMGDFYT